LWSICGYQVAYNKLQQACTLVDPGHHTKFTRVNDETPSYARLR
jgi:hypothetical protein